MDNHTLYSPITQFQDITGSASRTLQHRVKDTLLRMQFSERFFFSVLLLGALLVTISSYSAAAIQRRGGLLQTLGWENLTYGHAKVFFTALLWIGILLLIIAWALAGTFSLSGQKNPLILRKKYWYYLLTPLFFAMPLFSRDVYSYLVQGAMVRDGFNPYSAGPAVNPTPLLFEVSGDWRNTTTPYGPLHLWLGEQITRITDNSSTTGLFAYKALSIISFGVILWAVIRIAEQLKISPALAVWIGPANPLIIFHLIGGMHSEATMLTLVLCSVLLLLVYPRKVLLLIPSLALLSLAILLKATAAIFLPFFIWILVYQYAGASPSRWRVTAKRTWMLLLFGAASFFLTGLFMILFTKIMGQSWGWVGEMTGNSKVINPLNLSSLLSGVLSPLFSAIFIDINFNVLVSSLRTVSMVLMLISLILVWWIFRKDIPTALMGTSLAFIMTCLFNSVTLPWYFTPALIVVGLWVARRTTLFWVSVLSLIVCLGFEPTGDLRFYDHVWMLLATLLFGWLMYISLPHRILFGQQQK